MRSALGRGALLFRDNDTVFGLAISPDGTLLASAGANHTIRPHSAHPVTVGDLGVYTYP
ncbi:MAG TPA: WD40 repeat domain-containing protein [Chloroflexota bacterium]|nr:WD40 repeat domain-containing protein [Chloroflexota bacterium]